MNILCLEEKSKRHHELSLIIMCMRMRTKVQSIKKARHNPTYQLLLSYSLPLFLDIMLF